VIKKNDNTPEGEVKLEDILRSIRGIIDNDNNVFSSEVKKGNKAFLEDEHDNVLELTSILKENAENCLVSEDTKHHAKAEINKFNDALKSGEYVERSQSLDIIVNDLMRPLIKDWLDNNLPKIVENIVSEEIKKIIPKK
jgi:cell pole-organizing protein PopZ